MGFPVGYTEVFFPNLFLHTLSLLAFIRAVIFSLFHLIGLSDLLETTDATWPSHNFPSVAASPPISASIIRELLPAAVKFSDISAEDGGPPPPEGCAVCLHDFEGKEEIRRLSNCCHVFHRECLDRWMDHDQVTCPLCRSSVVPHHLREDFNRRLWAASGALDFYTADHYASF